MPAKTPKVGVMNTRADFDRAFEMLTSLLDTGADVLATDKHGNPAIARAGLDASQVIDEPISEAFA